jgi:hypothetical protein
VPSHALTQLSLVHGYTTAFWWAEAIFAGGAIIAALLFRPGRRSQAGGGSQQGHQASTTVGARQRLAAGVSAKVSAFLRADRPGARG